MKISRNGPVVLPACLKLQKFIFNEILGTHPNSNVKFAVKVVNVRPSFNQIFLAMAASIGSKQNLML